MLIAEKISKSFGNERALNEVSLRIPPGQFCSLVGRSGSGKSVLARALTGLEAIDHGSVLFNNKKMIFDSRVSAPDWTGLRRVVSYVPQQRNLQSYRTNLELVCEGPRYVLGLTKKKAIELAENCLAELGLIDHAHKYPTELSGGQVARVCLARSIAMRPDILICDEVTANLDPITSCEIVSAIQRMIGGGVSVLFITHQVELVRMFGGYLFVLYKGALVEEGQVKELLDNPSSGALRDLLSASS